MTEEEKQQLKNNSSEKLANAAYVLGIISLFSVFCCCPFVISAIGVTLALLSKGASEALKPKAKTGLILSIVGFVISIIILVGTIVMPIVLAKLNPEIGNQFKKQYMEIIEENEELYRQMYGDDAVEQFEELLEDL